MEKLWNRGELLDLKAFKISNAVVLIGICITLFLSVPIQIKQSNMHTLKEEKYYLNCFIGEVASEITNDETKSWLSKVKELRERENVNFLQIQLEEGQCVVPDDVFSSTEDKYSNSFIESLTYYLNECELYIVVEGNSVLSREYNQLDKICNEYGMSVEVAEHMEQEQNDTEIVKEKLYRFLVTVSVAGSAIILSVLEFFWFQKRKKMWRIRRIFGVSIVTLIKEIIIVQLILLAAAMLISLFALMLWYDFKVIQIIKYSMCILIEYVLINLLASIIALYPSCC